MDDRGGRAAGPGMMEIGYLGLGSNVGDRRANLQAAIERCGCTTSTVLAVLVGVRDRAGGRGARPARASTTRACGSRPTLDPEGLLDACKAVERALGRALDGSRGYVRHGPRPIDVDLLLLGEARYSSERLTLPHREVTSRRFVLIPLLELDPELRVPGHGRAADALRGENGVRRAGPCRSTWDPDGVLLVVDVGNTQTHLGTYDGDELVQHWRFATVRESTADELGAALRNLLALRGLSLRRPRRPRSSPPPCPQLRPEWTAMAERYLGHEMLVVGPGLQTGMPIRYDNPREIGADRLVNAVAGYDARRRRRA